MENINFSLNEIEINKEEAPDLTYFLGYEDNYDIEYLQLYYNTNFNIKGLTQILQYYGLQKNKMVKEEIIQILLFFETDPANREVVQRRLRLWQNIKELKADAYFSKYILF
jgi:hypothetical protein